MKEIKSFRVGDQLPDDAKFLAVQPAVRAGAGLSFVYEIKIPKKPTAKVKSIENDLFITNVIDYLNTKTGRNYKATSKAAVKMIKARMGEGSSLNDFTNVIDKKTSEWINNPDFNKYLRPSTLFGPNFESYLNQTTQNEIQTDLIDEVDSYFQEDK